MNEQTKSKAVQEASQSIETASAANPGSFWKRLMGKKWAFPAMYMVAAAIILTLMWAYQDHAKQASNDAKVETGLAQATPDVKSGQDALPVAATAESMRWPVKDVKEEPVSMPFYDSNASADAKQAAMLQYNDTFTPHAGVDFARQDDKPFDVIAAASGKVTAVEQNPLAGSLIEITLPSGMVTSYQSLGEVKVTKGADVKKGDVIATAGRNELEKDEGVHLHFEVLQNGTTVNPDTVISGQ